MAQQGNTCATPQGAKYVECGTPQVTVSRGGELQGPEADIVQGLVIEGEAEIRVLHKLVNRERAVVRLNNGVAHLRARHDRVGRHDAVRVLLTNLRNEESSHAG